MLVDHILLNTHVHNNQIMAILMVLLIANDQLFSSTFAVPINCYYHIFNFVIILPGNEELVILRICYLDIEQVESLLLIEHVGHDIEALRLFIVDDCFYQRHIILLRDAHLIGLFGRIRNVNVDDVILGRRNHHVLRFIHAEELGLVLQRVLVDVSRLHF